LLKFQIDIADTISEFSLQRSEAESLSSYIIDRVCDEYMARWYKLIDEGLHSTRDEYKKAIYLERPDPCSAIIGMTARESKIAMMIETGAISFDEKIGFEGSEKKHMKAKGNGWFLTIPFRHASSEAIMEMEAPNSGASIIDLMKSGATIGTEQLPEGFAEAQTHQMTLNTGSIITYKHKAPIYAGMHRRDISSTTKEKRGGYFTFRRVSDKSDPESWMHPGFGAHMFMDKALNSSKLGEAVDNAVQDWLDTKFA